MSDDINVKVVLKIEIVIGVLSSKSRWRGVACDLGGGCGDIAGCHCWVPGVLATCWVPFGCHLPCIGSYGWMPIFVRSLGATLGGVMLGCHVEALWGGVFWVLCWAVLVPSLGGMSCC